MTKKCKKIVVNLLYFAHHFIENKIIVGNAEKKVCRLHKNEVGRGCRKSPTLIGKRMGMGECHLPSKLGMNPGI